MILHLRVRYPAAFSRVGRKMGSFVYICYISKPLGLMTNFSIVSLYDDPTHEFLITWIY